MITKRDVIDSLRDKLRERSADTTYSNQFLYSVLLEQARWLMKREVSKGSIYKNQNLFSTLGCVEVEEVSSIDACCPIVTNCKMYRTKDPIPDIWSNDNGPMIRNVTSIDGSTRFQITTAILSQSKQDDPYNKRSSTKYAFFSNGYLWFSVNPHRVNIDALFEDDVRRLSTCGDNKKCVRFLDTTFMLPESLHAEMYAKSLEIIAGVTKKLPEDMQVDKNVNRNN